MPVLFRRLLVLGFVCTFSTTLLASNKRNRRAEPQPDNYENPHQYLIDAQPKTWSDLKLDLMLLWILEKHSLDQNEEMLAVLGKLRAVSASWDGDIDPNAFSYFVWCLETCQFCSFNDFQAEFPATFGG